MALVLYVILEVTLNFVCEFRSDVKLCTSLEVTSNFVCEIRNDGIFLCVKLEMTLVLCKSLEVTLVQACLNELILL